MARRGLISSMALVALVMLSGTSVARTWTDRTGRTVEARFVAIIDGKVSIKRDSDGKLFHVPISNLSDTDQAYIESLKSERTRPPSTSARSRTASVSVDEDQMEQQLIKIAFGMQNFHDVYRTFGGADGKRRGQAAGLSWRVHILPFMGERPLYEQFRIDEAWDSAHNRRLIAKMPEVYKTPGVSERGKTVVQVFVGEGTPFGAPDPPDRSHLRDSAEHTALFVVAGPEQATEWTKPGGIRFDAGAGVAALGTAPMEKGFPMAFMDASVVIIPPDVSRDFLSNLVRDGDQRRIDRDFFNLFSGDARRKGIAETRAERMEDRGEEEKKPEGKMKRIAEAMHAYSRDHHEAFPGASLGPEGETGLSWRVWLLPHFGEEELTELYGQFHLDEPWDSPHNVGLVERMPDFFKSARISESGKTTFHVFTGPCTPMGDERPARLPDFLDGTANTLMVVIGKRETAMEWTRPGGLPFDPADQGDPMRDMDVAEDGYLVVMFDKTVRRLPAKFARSEFVRAVQPNDGRRLQRKLPTYSTAKPKEEVSPALKAKRNFGEVSWALEEFESRHGAYPAASRDPKGEPSGLGWRVHLLPCFGPEELVELYEAFHLDEPWDSPHNKQLLDRMPAVYEVPGSPPGKTPFAMFTGPGTPLGGEEPPPSYDDIEPRAWHTIMVVWGGPETATEWTRPGGLPLDRENPLSVLGTPTDGGYEVITFDIGVAKLLASTPPEIAVQLIATDNEQPFDPELGGLVAPD